jgi:hypothetical protein
MTGVRQRLGRLIGGGDGAALGEQAEAIRQLQRQVADLTLVVTRLDAGSLDPEAWTSVRDGVSQAVDDLGRRIAALNERVERLERPDRVEA